MDYWPFYLILLALAVVVWLVVAGRTMGRDEMEAKGKKRPPKRRNR